MQMLLWKPTKALLAASGHPKIGEGIGDEVFFRTTLNEPRAFSLRV